MAKKRKARFNSLSTPGQKQDCSNYLVELAFLKDNRGIRLQPKFWRQVKYKFRYMREIQACRKFIKKYGESNVLYIAMHNHITTWTDFARVEFLLQELAERTERRKLPKDTSGVTEDFSECTEDFRTHIPSRRKNIGLFERLKQLEDLNG